VSSCCDLPDATQAALVAFCEAADVLCAEWHNRRLPLAELDLREFCPEHGLGQLAGAMLCEFAARYMVQLSEEYMREAQGD
jgi:hypothetical protein